MAFTDNWLKGYYSDSDHQDINFTECLFARNEKASLMFEIGSGPFTINQCVFVDNFDAIKVVTCQDVTIENSIFLNNQVSAIFLRPANRGSGDTVALENLDFEFGDSVNNAPVDGYKTRRTLADITIRNNLFVSNQGPKSRFIKRVRPSSDSIWMDEVIGGTWGGNRYYHANNKRPFEGVGRYLSFEEWEEATGGSGEWDPSLAAQPEKSQLTADAPDYPRGFIWQRQKDFAADSHPGRDQHPGGNPTLDAQGQRSWYYWTSVPGADPAGTPLPERERHRSEPGQIRGLTFAVQRNRPARHRSEAAHYRQVGQRSFFEETENVGLLSTGRFVPGFIVDRKFNFSSNKSVPSFGVWSVHSRSMVAVV